MFATRFDPNAKNASAKKSENAKKLLLLNRLKSRKTSQSEKPVEQHSENKNIIEQELDVEMKDIDEEDDKNIKKQETTLKRKRGNLNSDSDSDSDSESDSDSDSESDSDSASESESESDSDSDAVSGSESDLVSASNNGPDESYSAHEKKGDDETAAQGNVHSSVFSRFKKAMEKQSSVSMDELAEETEPVELKDVAPMPQLKLPKDKQLYSQSYKNLNLEWLTKPAYYDSDMTKPFKEFRPEIKPKLLTNLKNEFNIEDAFSVQITLIEELLKDVKRGKLDPTPRGDYLINAATGSGKTLSYLIPIVQYIIGEPNEVRVKDAGIKCIIIVPTKPLVQQVYSDALKLTKGTDLNVMSLKSGGDISINDEKSKLKSNLVDILITTPGRLVEHMDNIDINALRFLVVDEADRLLNQNFQDWCDLVMQKIESLSNVENEGFDKIFKLRCIKIVLSATLTTNSEKLTHLRLFRPRLVIVNTDNANELYQLPRLLEEKELRISEKLSYFKPLILLRFFQWVDKTGNKYNNYGMIFTKSNESTIRLNKLLNELNNRLGTCLNIGCINSMMDNQERTKILKKFDETGGILICTDLLSRGINLTSIKFVINYDLPGSTKEYVHRIGRTARAGNSGCAVTLCYGENEFKWFKKIVYSGQQINRNGKPIAEIKFVRDKQAELDNLREAHEGRTDLENTDIFELNISDADKQVYDESLKQL